MGRSMHNFSLGGTGGGNYLMMNFPGPGRPLTNYSRSPRKAKKAHKQMFMSDDQIQEESPDKQESEVEVIADHKSNSDIVEDQAVKFDNGINVSDSAHSPEKYEEQSVKMHSELGDKRPGHGDEETMYAKAHKKKGWVRSPDGQDAEPRPHQVIESDSDNGLPRRRIMEHQITTEVDVPSENFALRTDKSD